MLNAPANLLLKVSTLDALDVRWFRIREGLSTLFEIELSAVATSADLDLDAIVGDAAAFQILGQQTRGFTGVISSVELARAEVTGLSTYRLTLSPSVWLLSQRTNYRVFQDMSELDVALAVLKEWGIEIDLRVDKEDFRRRAQRVQYAESDLALCMRMLEDVGASFYFDTAPGGSTRMVIDQAPHARAAVGPLPFFDHTENAPVSGWVSKVRVQRSVRPGRYLQRDYDPRLDPTLDLSAPGARAGANGVEAELEAYVFDDGDFQFCVDGPRDTPTADDRVRARTHLPEALRLAQRRIDALRGPAIVVELESGLLELAPGVVLSVAGHPSSMVTDGPLLVESSLLEGEVNGEWTHRVKARPTRIPFRPALRTPRPLARGVEHAVVVGPPGEEIHTDELGRVRVQFPWDRFGNSSDESSTWVPVSQPWSGAGYGAINLPRVGQEVLVEFLGADPDRPVIMGRVYTAQQSVPYALPANKTQSGWKSCSTHQTGGFNELMFEDAAGSELVRMRAQRDLDTHVLHDERRIVDRDRRTVVHRDESTSIARDERHTVERDRTLHVFRDEERTIGGRLSEDVRGDATSQVKGRRVEATEKDRNERTLGSVSRFVGKTESSFVALTRSATVGLSDSTTVVGVRSVNVGLSQTFTVGAPGPLAALTGLPNTTLTMHPDEVKISTSKGASITLKGDTITIDAKELIFAGKSTIKADAPLIALNGPGLPAGRVTDDAPAIVANGSTSVQIGGPPLPLPVTKVEMVDGMQSIELGGKITVRGSPDFVSKTLAQLGKIGTTKAGKALFDAIAAAPKEHTLLITFRPGDSKTQSFLPGVDTNTEAGKLKLYAAVHTKGRPVYDGVSQQVFLNEKGEPMLYTPAEVAGGAPLRNGYPIPLQGTGDGASANVAFDPTGDPGPAGQPVERVLFHEMSHAKHIMNGEQNLEYMPGRWDNHEELATIQEENVYTRELGFPWHRIDHADRWQDDAGNLWRGEIAIAQDAQDELEAAAQ